MGTVGNASALPESIGAMNQSMFSDDIAAEWFTCKPCAIGSQQVGEIWRRFWQNNAENALQSAADGLGQSLDRLLHHVRNFDLTRRLAPRLCARVADLMEAMDRRDGYAVMDGLQVWCNDAPEDWYADDLITESIAAHAWEQPLLREIRSTQVSGMGPLEFFPLLESDTLRYHQIAMHALHLIAEVDPDMHAEISTHVSMIKLFTGSGIEGLSTPKAFGALWLKVPTEENALAWFLEHLVHECSHLHLNALFSLDPLLYNPNEIHQAPIRPDPRPMFQILHGTFVLARNCRVHARLCERFPELNLQPALEKFHEQFQRGIAVVEGCMKPTPRGALLLQSLSEAAA